MGNGSSEPDDDYDARHRRGGRNRESRSQSYFDYMKRLMEDFEDELNIFMGKLQSVKTEKVNDTTVNIFFNLTNEAERRIHDLNSIQRQSQTTDTNSSIHRLQTENKQLRSNCDQLQKENGQLQQQLQSTKQSYEQQICRLQTERDQNKGSHEKADKTREQREIEKLETEKSTLQHIIYSHLSYQKSLETKIKDTEVQIAKLQRGLQTVCEENESFKIRLSKVAGQKLMENNLAILDLNDPNRPTKLGEMYSEIYDNEWTDAFEQLSRAGYTEVECIETLKLTLLNILQFCQKKSEKLLQKTEEAVSCLFKEYKEAKEKNSRGHLTMPRSERNSVGKLLGQACLKDDEEYGVLRHRFEEDGRYIVLQSRWKPRKGFPMELKSPLSSTMVKAANLRKITSELTHFRKEVAQWMVPLVQKAYLSASWSSDCLPTLKKYIKKCLFLCWMMVVQSPPVVLDTCKDGDVFNKERYKEYTKTGPTVQFVVWPAILLHDQGPVIGKGVAQGQQ